MSSEHVRDSAVRAAAFRFLEDLSDRHGESLPWPALLRGFDFEGQRVPLLSQQGIFKPAALPRLPLSIRTSPVTPGQARPYDDGLLPDGRLVYRYRGTDPRHFQNRWLREAMLASAPLVYFHGTVPGLYVAQWPVFVVEEDPARLAFTVDLDGVMTRREFPEALGAAGFGSTGDELPLQRRYAEVPTRQRLHQRTFRDRVIRAYAKQCAVCHLRHVSLLDAAHILPDADPLGEPVVTNGLSLCKLHHAAYDERILGIRPDLVVEVQPSILRERDGPMLRHGLQGVHETKLWVPRKRDQRPDEDALARRYERFRDAS